MNPALFIFLHIFLPALFAAWTIFCLNYTWELKRTARLAEKALGGFHRLGTRYAEPEPWSQPGCLCIRCLCSHVSRYRHATLTQD